MSDITDWGAGGKEGFLRDPANEQTVRLAPNAVFTGGWTRIDKALSFLILYGTHVPFTMQIQWSKDGVARDTDPFASITPQVRFALGLYSVISPQSTFFRPFYRIVVTNGPSQQLFVVSDSILLNSIFPGYQISVDGPIPVLGLANLNIGLGWGRTAAGWAPIPLTDAGNQKIALAENLLGTLPVAVGNFPDSAGSYLRKTTLGATLVKTGAGTLKRLINAGLGGVVTLTLYDSLTATGPVIASLKTATNTTAVWEIDAKFTTGLTISSSAITDVTVVYK